MTAQAEWPGLAQRLEGSLGLRAPAIAITFRDETPAGVPAFADPLAPPAQDGRTGRVSAGCVFWMKATERTFATVPEDHGNCSVGRLTHGLAQLDEVAGNGDVAELLGSGWVTPEMVGAIPAVSTRAEAIVYGPLAETPVDPDVVLIRINGRQLMVLSDALGDLRIEGKPQCHIVAVAKEQGEVAASVGCALSRARTGMRNDEMTCAIPGARLAEVVDRVERTAAIDAAVTRYAAADARRFG
jgi:uncharacterized protein (DUF169 family)